MTVHRRLAWVALGALAGTATADDFSDFNELALEDLLNQKVVTASRSEHTLLETALSVTVLTRADIAATGATTIPDALRAVPGLDVMSPTDTSFEVSARGGTDIVSQQMLVLVDGRSVYADFFGWTMWEFLPVSLEEIESIEVIRGPVSALYGANALSGVINIITEPLGTSTDTSVLVRVAQQRSDRLGVVHRGSNGDFDYRVSAGRVSDWQAEDIGTDDVGRVQVTTQIATSTGIIGLSGGFTSGTVDNLPLDDTGFLEISGETAFARGDWYWNDVTARVFWNYHSLDLRSEGESLFSDERIAASDVDLELQHEATPLPGHNLVWGASGRFKFVNWDSRPDTHEHQLGAVFANDRWTITDNLIATGGLRYDFRSDAAGCTAPFAAAIWLPHSKHALRVSAGRAHRSPSYIERYWDEEFTWPSGVPFQVRSNANLEAETVESVEFGYQGAIRENFTIGATAYASEIDNLIEVIIEDTYPDGLPSAVTFSNGVHLDVRGIEGSLRYQIGNARFDGAYTYTRVVEQPTFNIAHRAPRHSARLQGRWSPSPNVTWTLTARGEGETEWTWTRSTNEFTGPAKGYVAIDAGVSLFVRPGHRLSARIENLTNERYREYPVGVEYGSRIVVGMDIDL